MVLPLVIFNRLFESSHSAGKGIRNRIQTAHREATTQAVFRFSPENVSMPTDRTTWKSLSDYRRRCTSGRKLVGDQSGRLQRDISTLKSLIGTFQQEFQKNSTAVGLYTKHGVVRSVFEPSVIILPMIRGGRGVSDTLENHPCERFYEIDHRR